MIFIAANCLVTDDHRYKLSVTEDHRCKMSCHGRSSLQIVFSQAIIATACLVTADHRCKIFCHGRSSVQLGVSRTFIATFRRFSFFFHSLPLIFSSASPCPSPSSALRFSPPISSRSRCPSVTLHVEVKESSPILHILTSDSPFWDVPTNLLVVRFSAVHRAKLEEIWLFLQFVALKWSKGPRKASQTWEVCTRALLPYASRDSKNGSSATND